MAKRLTATTVEQAKPGSVRRELPDKGCPGLYLVIQPNGAKSFALRFRSPVERDKHGQRRAKKLTLGPIVNGEGRPEGEPKIGLPLTLADARALATDAIRKVENGVDPTHERRAERSKFKETAASRDAIEIVFERFMDRYAKVHTRESSWSETKRLFDKRIKPKWKGRPVQSIVKRDVLELLDGIMDDDAPIMANRTLAVIRRFFNWCLERDILAASPCAGVKPPAPEKSRDRVLTDAELRAMWNVTGEEGYPFGPMVRMMVLTGQRVDEVREAPWSEFDTAKRLWTIPAARAKNNREHDVPLSDPALGVLEKLPRIKGKAGLLFTTTGETPVSGMSRAKARIDEAMLAELRKHDRKAAVEHWEFRDLRRTVYTGIQRLGFAVEIAEAVTNHISGTLKGVAGVYGRHRYAKEKAAALEAWAREVERIVSGKAAKVVRLRGQG